MKLRVSLEIVRTLLLLAILGAVTDPCHYTANPPAPAEPDAADTTAGADETG